MEGLRKKMTYQQMAEHMKNNTVKTVNRVNVGLYAKKLGYRVYKPMVGGRTYHYYVNEHIDENGNTTV